MMNFRQLMYFLVEQMKTQHLEYSISDLDCDIKFVDSNNCIEKYVIYIIYNKCRIAALSFEIFKKLDNYTENLTIRICNLFDYNTHYVDIDYRRLQYFKEYPFGFFHNVNSLVLDFLAYGNTDNSNNEPPKRERSLKIEKVIFNGPATIVFWKNGCKTVVKCQDNESFDPEKGLAMAIAKYALGNKRNYYKTFIKYLPKENECNKTESEDNLNNPVGCITCKYGQNKTVLRCRECEPPWWKNYEPKESFKGEEQINMPNKEE